MLKKQFTGFTSPESMLGARSYTTNRKPRLNSREGERTQQAEPGPICEQVTSPYLPPLS